MPSTRRARHLAPAFTAAIAGSALLAAPAAAVGNQTLDTTVRMQCVAASSSTVPFPYQVELRVRGTAPATTSPGESGQIEDNGGSTIRLLDNTAGNENLKFVGKLYDWSTQSSGGSSSRSGLGTPGSSFGPVAKSAGGYGPTAVSSISWGNFATERPEAVTVRATGMLFAFQIAALGSLDPFLANAQALSNFAECEPLAGQPPLAVVPYAARATPRPAVTSISPRTVRVGLPSPERVVPTKVTIKGEGFLGDTTPRVKFGAFEATDVTVIDDKTMTVLTPETWGATSGSVQVQVDDRTSANTPADDFRFITGLPIITSMSGMAWGNVGGILRLRGTEFERMKYITVGNRRVQPLFIIGSTDMFFLAPPLAKGMYRVTATNDVGTSETGDTITYR